MTKEQVESFKVDRTGWDPGPWDGEPDRVDFHHAGFPCLMLRHERHGQWCGYVGLPPGHPFYGKTYQELDLKVHGGLTYSAACDGEHICHVSAPSEPDAVWWLGFDCAHAFDLSPGQVAIKRTLLPLLPQMPRQPGFEDHYRTASYVRRHVMKLAKQLREAASGA